MRNVELGCQLNRSGVEDSEGGESDIAHEEMLAPFRFGNFPCPNVFVAAAGDRLPLEQRPQSLVQVVECYCTVL